MSHIVIHGAGERGVYTIRSCLILSVLQSKKRVALYRKQADVDRTCEV